MRRILVIFAISCAISACTTRIEYGPAAEHPAGPGAININLAAAGELQSLPGIGRGTAEAIVGYRAENGAFRRVEHIMQIRGVSERRFLEIRHLLKTE